MDKEQQKHLVAVEMALLALGMPPNLKGFYYIKVTFDRGNSKSKAKWFGSLLNVEREYPPISVFIATIAAQLRCQMFCMEEEAVKCTLEKRF